MGSPFDWFGFFWILDPMKFSRTVGDAKRISPDPKAAARRLRFDPSLGELLLLLPVVQRAVVELGVDEGLECAVGMPRRTLT